MHNNDWFVYIVRCKDGSLYTGITTDLERRIDEHNGTDGRAAKYTRARQPVSLVYSEEVPDRSSAGQREAAIKRMKKRQKERLIDQQ